MHVGFSCGEREKALTIAADRNWRIGFLDRERGNGVIGNSIMPAGESHLFAFQQVLDDPDRLAEPLDPRGSGIEGKACCSYSDWMLPAPKPS
jgi:hypothetical protein